MSPAPPLRVVEILPACIIAGCGMVAAGNLVDWVKFYYSHEFDSRLLAIIPPLIGLKGNLEVTLSSRLATLANLKTEVNCYTFHMFLITLVYILLQGLSAAVVISLICWGLHTPVLGTANELGLLHICTITVLTCSVAICALSILVFIVILACQKFGANPDNVAPPLAAALGDLGTVAILLFTNRFSVYSPDVAVFFAVTLFAAVVCASVYYLGCYATTPSVVEIKSLSITSQTLVSSVAPLLAAVTMSSFSGQILARFSYLPNLARLQIAINGVGGCFGSIVVSRMLTRIHSKTTPPLCYRKSSNDSTDSPAETDRLPPPSQMSNLAEVQQEAEDVSRLILVCCVPVHLMLALVSAMLLDWLAMEGVGTSVDMFTGSTVVAYVLAGVGQVFVVVRFAKWIVLTSWRHIACSGHRWPWFSCIPPTRVAEPSLAALDLTGIALTTGLGDLVGSVLLTSSLYYFQL